MFGLYPAGLRWTRRLVAAVPLDAFLERMTALGFEGAGRHEPFGADRGQLLFQRDNMWLLAPTTAPDQRDYLIVPCRDLQYLLWSAENGYASQWTSLELDAISKTGTWDAFMAQTTAAFDRACADVALAAAEHFDVPAPATTQEEAPSDSLVGEPVLLNAGDEPTEWTPAYVEWLMEEGAACAL